MVVLCDDAEVLRRFDELLWTFGDGSFVPHDTVTAADAPCDAPVALTTGSLPADHTDVLVNLGNGVPASFEKFCASGGVPRRTAGSSRRRARALQDLSRQGHRTPDA